MASEKARAASTPSLAVHVSGQSPTATTRAAPMNSTAIRMLKQLLTAYTLSYHTVSPER